RLADVVNHRAGLGAGAFALADMDGEGRRDAVIGLSDASARSLVVLLQTQPRAFEKSAEVKDVVVGTSIAPLDFDRDGDLDFVLAHGSVSLLGRSGALGFVTSRTFPAGPLTRDVLSGDFDGDGRADLAVAIEA